MVRCVSDRGWWSFEPNRSHRAGPPRTLPNLEAKKGPLDLERGNLTYYIPVSKFACSMFIMMSYWHVQCCCIDLPDIFTFEHSRDTGIYCPSGLTSLKHTRCIVLGALIPLAHECTWLSKVVQLFWLSQLLCMH